MKKFLALVGCGFSLVAWSGCGEPAQEAQLEALSERMDELRAGVEQARAKVDEKSEIVASATRDLADAETALAEAKRKLAAVEREAGQSATDPVLFRMIQKRLLEDADLEKVAIQANVSSGNVTLSGAVPDAELRDRAVAIAQGVPGVASVQSQIQVKRPVATEGPSKD